jgi:hypothetical protein
VSVLTNLKEGIMLTRKEKDLKAAQGRRASMMIWAKPYASDAEAMIAMYNHAMLCGEGEFEYQFSQFVGRYMAYKNMH